MVSLIVPFFALITVIVAQPPGNVHHYHRRVARVSSGSSLDLNGTHNATAPLPKWMTASYAFPSAALKRSSPVSTGLVRKSPVDVELRGQDQRHSSSAQSSLLDVNGNGPSPSPTGVASLPTSSSEAVSQSSLSPSATSPGGAPLSSSTSGKRGLSYNDTSLTSLFDNDGMSWAYNWGDTADGSLDPSLEYVPMLWSNETKYVLSWNASVTTAVAAGSSHLLSFNEPDQGTQANMDPVTAARAHIQYMNPWSESAQIGSPAITNGDSTKSPQGIDWLNAFFTACAGLCKVDFVAFHWYNDADMTDDFEQHMTDVITAASANGVNKVWLTEFGVTSGDAVGFLQRVLPVLDAKAEVEKYAYFMCGNGTNTLVTGTSLNPIGVAYS